MAEEEMAKLWSLKGKLRESEGIILIDEFNSASVVDTLRIENFDSTYNSCDHTIVHKALTLTCSWTPKAYTVPSVFIRWQYFQLLLFYICFWKCCHVRSHLQWSLHVQLLAWKYISSCCILYICSILFVMKSVYTTYCTFELKKN